MVYSYRFWDEDRNQHVTSKWEATLEAIRSGLGEPIVESGRHVSRFALDPAGRVMAARPEEK